MNNRYDLIVVGGGFAGISAAVGASRKGLNVLLIEKTNALGGAANINLVMPFMPYYTFSDKNGERVRENLCGGFFEEICDELHKLNGCRAFKDTFDEEILKLVLNRIAINSGVNLLFDTTVFEAKTDGDKICSVKAIGKSKVIDLEADSFIDATGDGELSMLSGCDFKVGREKDGLCQPMTLCFRMSGVDKDKYFAIKPKINELYKEFKEKGLIKNPREDVLIFDTLHNGILHFNTTRIVKLNPTDPFDITKAEIDAREQVFEVHKFLKENIEGFENSKVLSTALQIGIRESRKVVGEYTLNVEDLKSLRRFDDVIAIANYDIDIHNPEGSGTSHYYFKNGEWYEIPYRCLVPKGKSNLLVAGRCISSTHEAQASYRIMPFCSEIGYAAGVAVAVAHKDGKSVRDVDIKKVQEILRKEHYII